MTLWIHQSKNMNCPCFMHVPTGRTWAHMQSTCGSNGYVSAKQVVFWMLTRRRTLSGFPATETSYLWLSWMQWGNVAPMTPHKRAKQSGLDMANTDVFFVQSCFCFFFKKAKKAKKKHVCSLNPFPAGGVLCTDDQGEEVFLWEGGDSTGQVVHRGVHAARAQVQHEPCQQDWFPWDGQIIFRFDSM